MRVLLVTGDHPRSNMGGAEYQTLLIARGLAARGHEVRFLGVNAGEEGAFDDGGVGVRRLRGWRTTGVRAHRERVRDAFEAFGPEVTYTRTFDELSILVPISREAGVPAVSVSCHVRETSPFLRSRLPREVLMHARGFRAIGASTIHVCNTQDLAVRVARWYPRHPVQTIYNGSPEAPAGERHEAPSGQVIWVNNLKPWKRPEAYVALARRLPRYRFLMVGRMAEGRYGRRIGRLLAEGPGNLEYLGPRPIEEVNRLIAASDLLLYTSLPVEGFGNSFLQAWFRQVPTVSLNFDLDGIPEREGIGRSSPDLAALVRDVETLMEDHEVRMAMGRRALAYARAHHSVERLADDYERLFVGLAHEEPALAREAGSGAGRGGSDGQEQG
jgi:glycosyltransferase involved in cell wall biosynthesis